MENIIPITVHRLNRRPESIELSVKKMFNAGWAGSDRVAVQYHIDELQKIGVAPPQHIPTLFALGNHMLSCSSEIQVHGDRTSGETEYVLFLQDDELFVTVGSDHTDRKLEEHSIPKSKNLCLNVMASEAWPFEEVKDHFSQLVLECTVTCNGRERPYQKDQVAALLGPDYWIETLTKRLGALENGLVFFSGTIGTVTGLVVGERYAFRLIDPVLNRSLSHQYDCHVLTGAIEDY